MLVTSFDGAGPMRLYVDARGGMYFSQSADRPGSFEMLIVDGVSYLRSPSLDPLRWVSLGGRTVWRLPVDDSADASATPEGLAHADLIASAHGFLYQGCLETGFPVETASAWEFPCPDEATLLVEVDDDFRLVRSSSRNRYHVSYDYPTSTPATESACTAVCPETFAAFAPLAAPSAADLLTGPLADDAYAEFHRDFLRRVTHRTVVDVSSLFLYGRDPSMSIVDFNEFIARLVAKMAVSSYADVEVKATRSDRFVVSASAFGVSCTRVLRLTGSMLVEQGESCSGGRPR